MAGIFELSDSLDQARTLTVVIPTGGISAGDFVAVGQLNGFYFTDGDFPTTNTIESDSVTVVYRGRQVTATKASVAITQGDTLYWDSGSSVVTTASTGNTIIGVALLDAATAAATVEMLFDGMLENF